MEKDSWQQAGGSGQKELGTNSSQTAASSWQKK
jgi:hypothetical protein